MTAKSRLKPFEPMLASPRGKLIFPCYVQPKFDGIRCVVRGGVALTRKLEPIPNNAIREFLSHPQFDGFDGELVDGEHDADVYNRTNSTVMSADGDPTNVVFNVFDCFAQPEKSYQMRYAQVMARMTNTYVGPLETVPTKIAENEDDLQTFAEELFALGYEGAIVRDMNAEYKYGRATEREGSMWKIKRMEDDEMLVIRCEERNHNENEATTSNTGKTKRGHSKAGMKATGMLGVLVGINDEKWPGEEIRVGSSNLPKMKIADANKHFVNKLVTFKHQPAGAKDAPRFPIYKGVRDPRDL